MAVTRGRHAPRRRKRVPAKTDGPATHTGCVVTHHGRSAVVEDSQGTLHLCTARRSVGTVVCGDRVAWSPAGPEQGIVTACLPRCNLLSRSSGSSRSRPLAANIDQVVIVAAPQPPLAEELLDRYLVAAELLPARSLIVVNKKDLLTDVEYHMLAARMSAYQSAGYQVIFTASCDPSTLPALRRHLQGITSILVGQSGVGKSSLVNALLPQRDARVGALSAATGLGRHTTSATTLYHLPDGGDLIDSPGVRSFHLQKVAPEDLGRGFPEFRPYLGQCRFHNCQHISEPGCAIAAAAERGQISLRRLASYRRLLGKAS